MSQQTSGHVPETAGTDTSTTQVARDEAAQVGRSTAEAGQHVAGTAKDQAGEVVQEARRQAKDLLGEARGQAAEQARNGQQKATEGLRTLATELHQMADGGEQHGPASDLAKQAATRIEDAAEWLSRREPGDLLGDVRGLARRRPGAFLIGAALAGVLAGRLTRGAVDANRDTSPSATPPQPGPRAAHLPPPAYPNGPLTPLPYDQPGGAALPPDGPIGRLSEPAAAPRPYTAAPDGPIGSGPIGGADPLTYPAPSGPGHVEPSGPGPVPVDPAADGLPAHAPRPGATTVGDYVQDVERGAVPAREDGPR